MKRLGAGLLFAALLASAQADETRPADQGAAAATLQALPGRIGYAVDQPEILLRQRLFGLAHGLSLLAAACLDLPAHSAPVQDAYAAWHVKQAKTIETVFRDLASYYFGPRADEARWPDLSRALNLTDNIQPALGEVTLHAACATLPEAIARPRYALDTLLSGTVEAETLPHAVAAAASPQSGIPGTQSAPAPTLPGPAE